MFVSDTYIGEPYEVNKVSKEVIPYLILTSLDFLSFFIKTNYV